MSKKPAKTEPPPELKALEQKVDAMMDTKAPAKAAVTKKTSTLKVVSAYAGNPQTAPELSPKPRKSGKAVKEAEPETIPETVPEPEISPDPEAPVPLTEPPESIIEDPDTDRAVADIVIREGDTQLAVEDAIARRKNGEAEEQPGATISGYWLLLLMIIVVGTAAVAYLWFR